MDSSPVVAPNSSNLGDSQNNSSPKLESSEMETEKKAHNQSADKSDTDSAAVGAASEPGSSSDTAGEKPAETTQSADSKNESAQVSSPLKLYPVLSEDEHTTGQDSKEKQGMDSTTEKPLETDSDASFVVLGKSNCEVVSNSQSSILKVAPSKDSVNSNPSASSDKESKRDSENITEQGKVDDAAVASAAPSAPLAEPEPCPSPQEAAKGRPETLLTMASEPGTSSGTEGGAVGGKTGRPGQGESVYYVKWIMFNNNKVPIVTQNENGPCPLLAIMNVLLLKGKVHLTPLVEMITSEQLMAYLGDCVMESKPKNLDEAHRANYEQNMQDAMNMMYKLQTGLDVNVKFTGVSDFEYTSECIIFDLLRIALYHGWLVDPQDQENVKAVGKCSYNQLVEKVIQNKNSAKDDLVQEALIAEQFLDGTASQLTYHGLCELSSTVKEQELCVFFRNNHFNTLYRHNNELFLLVTDQGFLTESNVVWETLSNVDGDCHFVDANFCTYTKPQPSTEPIASSPYYSGDEQINSDYQVALSLQHQDQQMIAEQEAAWGQFHNEFGAAQTSDHELALRLQEEEDRRAAAALQEQRNQQAQAQGQAVPQGQAQAAAVGGDRRQPREREDRRDKKEGKDCCIL